MQFRVRRIRGGSLLFTLAAVATGVMTGCSHLERKDADTATAAEALASAIEPLKAKYAPDEHLGVYKVGVESLGHSLALTGEVDRVEARSETLAAAERIGLKVDLGHCLPERRQRAGTAGA